MDSSLLDDGMILGETFCTQYRLDKAKARILALDKIITPVMSFAEVMEPVMFIAVKCVYVLALTCILRSSAGFALQAMSSKTPIQGAVKNVSKLLGNNIRTLLKAPYLTKHVKTLLAMLV